MDQGVRESTSKWGLDFSDLQISDLFRKDSKQPLRIRTEKCLGFNTKRDLPGDLIQGSLGVGSRTEKTIRQFSWSHFVPGIYSVRPLRCIKSPN